MEKIFTNFQDFICVKCKFYQCEISMKYLYDCNETEKNAQKNFKEVKTNTRILKHVT